MTTDPLTGLPKLPEGQWWEVTYEVPWDFGYWLHVKHNVTVPEVVDLGKHWWSHMEVTPEHTEEKTVECVQIIAWSETNPVPLELTEDLILAAADKLLAKMARHANNTRLTGKYPPNKLDDAK